MEYTIQQLAKLTGLTARTLRWYDQIGLLKPSRTAPSGCRCYGPAEVDRLQEILYYRALGVRLASIRECLDAPDFDRLDALRGHLAALESRREELDRLIGSVQRSIQAEERKIEMKDTEKFEALKQQALAENEQAYGQEARQRYGEEAVNQSNAAFAAMTPAQYQEWQALDEELRRRLEEAVKAGLSPESEEGRALAQLHRRWLSFTIPYDPAKHRGIAELYLLDERFTAYYDRSLPGCARFLRDAVMHWVR